MTSDQKKAYEWAKNQNYPSVAARYAKELAGLVDELQVASCARQEQERNAPLTLDDLKRSLKFGYPVWLVGMEDGDGWVFIHHVDSCSVRYARVGDSNEWCFRTKSYGVRVFAYLDGPKEEQHDID